MLARSPKILIVDDTPTKCAAGDPRSIGSCPAASFAAFYEPLQGAGGDFYDVVTVDDDVFGYFVADVSGHGVSAAFRTSGIKALLLCASKPARSIRPKTPCEAWIR